MPNWCEGTLRIRGTMNSLKNFLENGVQPVTFLGDDKKALQISLSEDGTCLEVRDGNGDFNLGGGSIWLKWTRRHFIEPDYIEVYTEDVASPTVLAVPFKAAWAIDPEQLREISEHFKVDFRVFGIERGMEFCQNIEIIDGKITKEEEIQYEDWYWDCPFPNMGG